MFGLSPATTSDEETYAQIDAEYRVDMGPMNVIKFGLRGTDHDRSNFTVAQGPNWANTEPGTANTNPAWNGTTYPSDFASDLGGDFPAQCMAARPRHPASMGRPALEPRHLAHLLQRDVQLEGKDQGDVRLGRHGRRRLER
ncbi:hypothetical protein LP420_09105 [Massilia sp. B-10]|nr:hypothetical protein LP420_09105 [Massilia sp. B-10]